MCAIIIIRMTLIADYPSPRSVIWISVKGGQIDREGWSVYLKYTGKVQAGESSTTACLREVREEIGLILCEHDISFLYRSIGADMLFDDYIVILDFQINEVILNLSEVSKIKWASLDEIMHLYIINKFMYNNILELSKVKDYLKTHLADFQKKL